MEPEKEEGNVEYKLKLLGKTKERIEGLASQMRYRCDEGGSECIYNIGVSDDGTMVGISDSDFAETIITLNSAADTNNYSTTILTTTPTEDGRKVYEVLVRENNDNTYIDIKVAVAGSVDSGKSSTLSVLTQGKNDDGRGSARLAVFNFAHEVKSGRTSSIAHHIMGFNSGGNVVNYRKVGKMSWPDIVQESSKIISFFDLAGHEKYLKTTILGLASSYPDVCFITVGANKGILRMTREHIFLCITLKIPFVIILTKIDIVEKRQNVLKNTLSTINKILKSPGVRRIPMKVNTHEDVILCAKNVASESIVPIFHISNVTGSGIDKVKKFLNFLGRRHKNFDHSSKYVEYHVDSTFTVAGVGTVTGGHLHSGTINVGDKLWLGPRDSKYTKVTVRSIHCKRVSLQSVKSGSYVCLALNKVNRGSIRRGSVMISLKSPKLLTKTFTANITVMKAHSTTVRIGYESVLHASSIRQTAKIVSISNKKNGRASTKLVNDNVLRTGDNADVLFEFKSQPEYLKVGTRLLLVEGRAKVVGVVI
jgi:GTPase